MRKKFLYVFIMFVLTLFSLVNVNAATKEDNKANDSSLFNIKTFNEIYKLSEQNEKINLPFINIFSSSATYDEIVKHSGISIGSSTIDVNKKLEGLQTIVTNDMITIKGEVENGIIYGNNVVIEGKITGDSLILSPNVIITKDAIVSRDVIIVANELEISGTVEGNVIAVVSDMSKINGTIKGEYRTITGNVDVENSDIKGDIYIKTDSDTTKLLEKYENATIVPLDKDTEKDTSKDILNIVIKGLITVIVYTAICFVLTRKEDNIVKRALDKFKDHTVYGIIMAFIYFMLILIIPVVLILLVVIGLGIIAWPIFIVYVALFLLSLSTSTLVVGMTIYEAIKSKVEKYKLPAIIGIFVVLFVLSNIPAISYYVLTAINLVSLAIILTFVTKKNKNIQEESENIK